MELKPGLCDPPKPVRLYVGTEGEASWYTLDGDNNRVPEPLRGLCGRLDGLKLVWTEYKGKPHLKLDVIVQADRRYIIRSGLDTAYSRGLVLGLHAMLEHAGAGALHQMMVFAVEAGNDEKVVFNRLYWASGEPVKFEWDTERDLMPLLAEIAADIGQELAEPAPPHGAHGQQRQQKPLQLYQRPPANEPPVRRTPAPRTIDVEPGAGDVGAEGDEETAEEVAQAEHNHLDAQLQALWDAGVPAGKQNRASLDTWVCNQPEYQVTDGLDSLSIHDKKKLLARFGRVAQERKAAGRK